MAFENLTLFEVHVDGTEFGSVFGGSDDVAADEEMAAAAEDRPGAGRKRRYVAFVGLFAVGAVAARRLRRRRAGGEPIDVDVDGTEEIAADDAVVHEGPVDR